MKRRTWLIIVALIALLTALAYLAAVLLWHFGILPYQETEEKLFVTGYWFLPLPVVGLLAGILLQVCSVRGAKKKKQRGFNK